MPRYTILEHDHPFLHWDFLVEVGTALRGWRLAHQPQEGLDIAVQTLPEHRLIYLNYEGPISGGRGCVQRWDSGTCTLIEEGSLLQFHFQGQRLRGWARLEQASPTRGTFTLVSGEG
jgi:hypothetical protein